MQRCLEQTSRLSVVSQLKRNIQAIFNADLCSLFSGLLTCGFVSKVLDKEPVDATKNPGRAQVLVPNTCELDTTQISSMTSSPAFLIHHHYFMNMKWEKWKRTGIGKYIYFLLFRTCLFIEVRVEHWAIFIYTHAHPSYQLIPTVGLHRKRRCCRFNLKSEALYLEYNENSSPSYLSDMKQHRLAGIVDMSF